MNYKILDIDPIARTILIEWGDGLTLNHAIPVDYLKIAIRSSDLIKDRAGAAATIDAIIKKERS